MAKNTSGRPAAPKPLSDDDMPTEIPGYSAPGYAGNDDLTEVRGSRQYGDSMDEDEKTEYGRYASGDDDVTEFDFVETTPQGLLWVKEGRRRGKVHMLKDDTLIGRKNGDLIIDEPRVSDPHAKIVFRNDSFVIVDFLSKNGTTVNGVKIDAATPLKENDIIKIADVVFVLKVLD